MTEEEEIVEPLLPEPEPQELPPEESEAETALEEAETADAPLREPTPLEESSEEEPPPPKRVRKAREPKAKAQPKAEPKRRGRPPGARNKLSAAHELLVRAPAPVLDPMAAELPAQSAMEQIMASMRERRQAHQERQHLFFQSFLP